jgi:TRAP-type transport system periplasmic protein
MSPKSFRLIPFLVLPFLGVDLSAQTTVTFSTAYAKGSAMSQILERAAADISKRTAGQVTLKISYNASQGTETTVVGKMRKGQIDGALLTAEGLKTINPALQVLELPFLVNSPAEAKRIHFTCSETFRALFAGGGFRLACWADPGSVYIFSRDPINDRSSLALFRISVFGYDQPAQNFLRKYSANCLPMGEPEILPSLQTGSINACYGTAVDAAAQQWYTKIYYATKDPFRYRSGAVVFHTGLEQRLSPELFAVLVEAFSAAEPDFESQFMTNALSAGNMMEKGGIQFLPLNAATRADFQKTAAAVWEEKSGTLYPKEVLEEIRGVLRK